MIKFVFIDLDDTLFDFHKAEQIALSATLEHFGLPSEQKVLDRYHEINTAHWKRLERGEITRQQVKVGRYKALLDELGVEGVEPEEVTAYYESRLAIGHYFIDSAEELLENLSKKYRLFLASNGALKVQKGRLKSSGIEKYFEQIFISEEIGSEKPNVKFFEGCFAKIPNFNRGETVIIGDSLTSDIKGGKNVGIKTLWFNKNNTVNDTDITPDYEVRNLSEIKAILENIQE